jgi:FkbM family methyltransferase
MRALTWRTRLMMSPEVWRLVRDEKRLPGTGHWSPPVVVEGLRTDLLSQWQIDGFQYWVPENVGWGGLEGTYEEIFRPDHPHYYLYRGCDIRADDAVIDAGASEGFFTRFALQRGARVLALEPSGVYVNSLKETFAAEISEGRVVVRQGFLSDKTGTVSVSLHACGWAVRGAELQPGTGVQSEVDQVTIDSLAQELPWPEINFVKMDIEGAEREAVRGAARTLKRFRPRLSIAVYHSPTGYFAIKRDLLALRLGYHVEAKGIYRLVGMPVPKMLHCWTGE